jgi:TetR/AcrR family transcriptional repressor of nem operon
MARNKAFDETQVLDKAVEIFWSQGYNCTSANDLVNTLGLSRSSLYDTYGDKHALFVQALKRYKQELGGKLIEMIEQTEDVKATITEILQMIVEQDRSAINPKGCFMVNTAVELSGTDPEIANIVNGNRVDIEKALQSVIKIGQEKGQLSSKHDSIALARYFINTFFGLRISIKFNNDPKILKDIIEVSLSILD